jgi:hypothetical protein
VAVQVAAAGVVGAVLAAIGRWLLGQAGKKAAEEAAKKAAQEAAKAAAKKAAEEAAKQTAKRTLKDEIKDELKDQVTQQLIDLAFEAVQDVVGTAGQEMKEEANRKATELRLISTGSPNPTAPRQPQYKPYYERKIPFRPVICRILCLADRNPILSKVRTKIPVDQESADYEIKERTRELRQLAAAIAFDLLDSALDYQSFIKSEVAYKRDGTAYCNGTHPLRIGMTYWRKPRKSISPDISIVEIRQNPPHKDNLFAVVDFKFPNDRSNPEQMKAYDDTFTRSKVSLVRFPEDCPKCEDLDKKKSPTGKDDAGKSRRRRTK